MAVLIRLSQRKCLFSRGSVWKVPPCSAGEQCARCHTTPLHFGPCRSPDLPFQGFLQTDKSGKWSKEECLVTTHDKRKLLKVEFWGKPQEECIISHQSTRPISWYAVFLFYDIFLSFSEVGTSEFLSSWVFQELFHTNPEVPLDYQ